LITSAGNTTLIWFEGGKKNKRIAFAWGSVRKMKNFGLLNAFRIHESASKMRIRNSMNLFF
jgi:hypothetical protein